MAYHAEASPSDSRRDPAFGGGSNGDRPLEFTVPVYKLGGGDKSYTTQIIKTGSRESSREAVSGQESSATAAMSSSAA